MGPSASRFGGSSLLNFKSSDVLLQAPPKTKKGQPEGCPFLVSLIG
jgi:hypothetical protein